MENRPKILIVDDEPFNIDYLEQELEDLGYATLSAGDGQAALEIVATESPDMILLDIMMPVMNGFEVLSRLKENKAWRDIPVVIISAIDDMQTIAQGIEMGAEDYLPKPFEPVLLMARMKAGLEKKRLRDMEQTYLQGLERELEIGREIQADFLPKTILQPEGWEIATSFVSARETAGDYYDVFQFTGDKIGLMLGDVCDKGLGSALYMTLFRSLLRAASDIGTWGDNTSNPKDDGQRLIAAAQLTNNYITTVHQSASYSTLFYGILDPASGELCYLNAGHEPPLILRDSQIRERLKGTGPVVGLIEDAEFRVGNTELEPGELLLVYSDGFTDVQNPHGEMYSREKLLSLFNQPFDNAQSLVDRIVSEVSSFRGDAIQFDDMTLMAVMRKG